MDENPYKDFNYYRIKQVDYDGEYDYSTVVLVNSMVDLVSLDVNMYPNPASDIVRLEIQGGSNKGTVDVINVQGTVVKQLEVDGYIISFDVSNFDTGIYFVRYTEGDRKLVKRLVVKH